MDCRSGTDHGHQARLVLQRRDPVLAIFSFRLSICRSASCTRSDDASNASSSFLTCTLRSYNLRQVTAQGTPLSPGCAHATSAIAVPSRLASSGGFGERLRRVVLPTLDVDRRQQPDLVTELRDLPAVRATAGLHRDDALLLQEAQHLAEGPRHGSVRSGAVKPPLRQVDADYPGCPLSICCGAPTRCRRGGAPIPSELTGTRFAIAHAHEMERSEYSAS